MSLYRLVDDGYSTFKKIMTGKKWIGRVCRHIDGRYMGMIGSTFIAYADTEQKAFEEAVARWLGYPDASALKERTKNVRRQRRRAATVGRYAADQMLKGNFEPLNQLFKSDQSR